MSAHKIALIGLAEYYEKALTDDQIKMYSAQLEKSLTPEEAAYAIQLYIDDPKNEFFPRPISKLIALVKKPVENKDLAQSLVLALNNAIRKYDVYWTDGTYTSTGATAFGQHFEGKDRKLYTTWDDALQSEVGSLGAIVVRKFGGWKHICEYFFNQPEGVFNAQVLKISESLMNLDDKGLLNALPWEGKVQGLIGTDRVLSLLPSLKTIEEGEI